MTEEKNEIEELKRLIEKNKPICPTCSCCILFIILLLVIYLFLYFL